MVDAESLPEAVRDRPVDRRPAAVEYEERGRSLRPDSIQQIVITGIELGVGDWVRLLVKVSVAAIPAMIIISLVWLFIGLAFTVLIGGLEGVSIGR